MLSFDFVLELLFGLAVILEELGSMQSFVFPCGVKLFEHEAAVTFNFLYRFFL